MAIPLKYNLRSVTMRWKSAIVAVMGIAGTVGVFVAVLSLARGFRATVMSSGSAWNAMVRRSDSSSEVMGAVELDAVRIIEDAPDVARSNGVPLVSPEVVVVGSFIMKSTGNDVLVQVRGTSERALRVRNNIRMAAGRFFRAGSNELVVGKNAATAYAGMELGDKVHIASGDWTVVGVFDAGGSSFDSEVWCDANLLNQVYGRPQNIFQSVTVRLTSPEALPAFRDALLRDPRLNVRVEREVEYYDNQSRVLTTLIMVLGSIVAVVMAVGAVFAALNTMYSSVAERSREVATLRALGFGEASVLMSFVVEALVIAAVGGAVGCAAVLPINRFAVGAMNFQTFSHLAFAFRVTPDLMLAGMGFALLMGVAGGIPPAFRAARSPVAMALRQM